jgi:hypothetical protein
MSKPPSLSGAYRGLHLRFCEWSSSLLLAFEGWSRIAPPAKGKRIFQLRTCESPSSRDHLLKMQMFHSGEFEIFKKRRFPAVFLLAASQI